MNLKKVVFVCLFFVCIVESSRSVSAKAVITSLRDEVDILQKMKDGGVHQDICDKHIDRYVVIKGIEYYDFNGNLLNDGSIVVNDAVADGVVKIFEELKTRKFPVEQINPVIGRRIVYKLPFGLFGWKEIVDDENTPDLTTAYCCRPIEHTNKLSLHSFGTALDLNMLRNPCIFIDEEKQEIINVVPKQGVMYLNRKIARPNKPYGFGKIDDSIVEIFQKHGFDIWGGDWNTPIDYQHFQVSTREFADLIMFVSKGDARKIFNKHTECFNKNNRSLVNLANEKQIVLIEEYKNDNSENKNAFFKLVDDVCNISSKKKQIKNR